MLSEAVLSFLGMADISEDVVPGLVALLVWGLISVVVQEMLASLFLSHNVAGVVGAGPGFLITFIGFSVWYYRHPSTGE